jgi:2-phosphoglycerate kinase
MPETIVYSGDRPGLPYSKGLTAQQLSASGLSLERSYEIAVIVERRLAARPERRIDTDDLRELVHDVVRDEEGGHAARRFSEWQRLGRLDRPLVVMLSGSTGVGKSTLASLLAARLGINRVIATDVIRQVLRAFFSREFMPVVHYSAFEAGEAIDADEVGDPDLVGFTRQAQAIATGVDAIVDRACTERTPIVLEGIHLVPGTIPDELRERCFAVEALLVVEDEELHRGHFTMRGSHRPPERYLRRFEQIRKLQDHLAGCAREEGVTVIDNTSVDRALPELMDLVLDSISRLSSSEAR